MFRRLTGPKRHYSPFPTSLSEWFYCLYCHLENWVVRLFEHRYLIGVSWRFQASALLTEVNLPLSES